MVIPSLVAPLAMPPPALDAILLSDAPQLEAPMAHKLTGQQLQKAIDLDFSDYGRSPRQPLGLWALGYFSAIVLLIVCMWEPWA